jgi:hypothetical protein
MHWAAKRPEETEARCIGMSRVQTALSVPLCLCGESFVFARLAKL